MTPQPKLDRIPQGALLGSDRVAPSWPQAVVSFTDGHWHPVAIVAWCRYRRGWAALIRWPDGHEDWRSRDPRPLKDLDDKITRLATRLDELAPADDPAGRGYHPSPSPRFWKLDGQARGEAVARLRAWVDHVYQPGYGHLAVTLGSCWEQHPRCLYALDWLSELWSALYLQPRRTTGALAGQAEWQTRLLPAAGDQMAAETAPVRARAAAHRAPNSDGSRVIKASCRDLLALGYPSGDPTVLWERGRSDSGRRPPRRRLGAEVR